MLVAGSSWVPTARLATSYIPNLHMFIYKVHVPELSKRDQHDAAITSSAASSASLEGDLRVEI